jgi:hypothetical protein
MHIGLPISVSVQGSNVPDDVQTLEDLLINCQNPTFSDGFELSDGHAIYEYHAGEGVIWCPKVWDTALAQDPEAYQVGDIVFKDCKIQKVTQKSGTGDIRLPKEPFEYSCFDEDIDPSTWTCRYFRVKADIKCGWLNRTWHFNHRWYYLFWEARGYGGCGSGGWRWSAKDTTPKHGCRHITWYLRSCLQHNYSTSYEQSKDIKAQVVNWVSSRSVDKTKRPTVQFKSMVFQKGYFFFRTSLDIPPEYKTVPSGDPINYTFSEITSPADIPGFRFKELTNLQKPFDGKNYTAAKIDTSEINDKAEYTFITLDDCDSIAFGKVLCDSIDVHITDLNGNPLFELNNFTVDNGISTLTSAAIDYPATLVIYSSENIPAESVVKVTLNGSYIEIGEILPAQTIPAGFTKVNFKNNYRDFSPKEQDQWGNVFYKDGVRVSLHSGTCELPIMKYDELNRLMLLVGGNKVVINSSDSIKNQLPDGWHVFEATQMIGRFTKFELNASEQYKRIGETATYSFTIEEIV